MWLTSRSLNITQRTALSFQIRDYIRRTILLSRLSIQKITKELLLHSIFKPQTKYKKEQQNELPLWKIPTVVNMAKSHKLTPLEKRQVKGCIACTFLRYRKALFYQKHHKSLFQRVLKF